MKTIKQFLCEKESKGLFKDRLSDIRKQGKQLIQKLSKQESGELEKTLRKDLTSKGFTVSELILKLGRFRGNYFVTTCKITLKPKNRKFQDENDSTITKLLNYLKEKYSHKFKIKSVENGEAKFNVR